MCRILDVTIILKTSYVKPNLKLRNINFPGRKSLCKLHSGSHLILRALSLKLNNSTSFLILETPCKSIN